MVLKNSKQRNTILSYLRSTDQHPSADMVYENVRKEIPNISLGTVYRNLALLCELGEISKLNVKNGPDRFDYRIDTHYHFECVKCGKVEDLDIRFKELEKMDKGIEGASVLGHTCNFYGICKDCQKDSSIKSLQ